MVYYYSIDSDSQWFFGAVYMIITWGPFQGGRTTGRRKMSQDPYSPMLAYANKGSNFKSESTVIECGWIIRTWKEVCWSGILFRFICKERGKSFPRTNPSRDLFLIQWTVEESKCINKYIPQMVAIGNLCSLSSKSIQLK